MLYTRCTVHDGHGGRCGVTDLCTHVRTIDAAGVVMHEHDVCLEHRQSLGLSLDKDCDLTPAGMRIFEAS